jgi:hypothetical protein
MIIVTAKPELTDLVPTKGVKSAICCGHQCVGLPTCHLKYCFSSQGHDRLGDEHIVGLAMPEAAMVTPAKNRRLVNMQGRTIAKGERFCEDQLPWTAPGRDSATSLRTLLLFVLSWILRYCSAEAPY